MGSGHSYKFAPVAHVRMNKVLDEAERLEFAVEEALEVVPEEDVEPGGLVADYLRSAKGCIEGARAMLARAIDEANRLEGRGVYAATTKKDGDRRG